MTPTSRSAAVTGVPGGGGVPSIATGSRRFLEQAAVLHAGGHLLTQITALVPIHALQFIEAVFQKDRLFHLQVTTAVRHTKRSRKRS